jgi:hypothetical protein
MTAEQYHADPCPAPSLSSSTIKRLINGSPFHAWFEHPRLNPDFTVEDQAEHFAIGDIAHQILLGGASNVQVLDFQDWRTKAAKEARTEAQLAGQIPLLTHVWADVEAMVASTRAQLDAHEDGRAMFRDGRSEQVIVWAESDTWCRAMLDYQRPGAIDDYKTTGKTANPEELARAARDYGWDIQAAWYRRGVKALTGFDVDFRFAVQETFAPYLLSVVASAPSRVWLAESQVEYALDRWRRCLARGEWPAYSRKTAYLTLPKWEEQQWIERQERDGV